MRFTSNGVRVVHLRRAMSRRREDAEKIARDREFSRQLFAAGSKLDPDGPIAPGREPPKTA